MYLEPLPSFGLGTQYVLEVSGGKSPYAWFVTGTVFSLTYENTDDGINYISSDLDPLSVGTVEEITVTDSNGVECSIYCSVCHSNICCDGSPIPSFSPYNETEVVDGMYIQISIIDGCPPFIWFTGDSEFSFRNEITNIRTNYLLYTANYTTVTDIGVLCPCGEADLVETAITGIPRSIS